MNIKMLDGVISDCIDGIKDAVADTNKMVLTKRDITKLRAIKKRLEYTGRQLEEIYAFVSTRLYKSIGEQDGSSNGKSPADRLAKLPEEQ